MYTIRNIAMYFYYINLYILKFTCARAMKELPYYSLNKLQNKSYFLVSVHIFKYYTRSKFALARISDIILDF